MPLQTFRYAVSGGANAFLGYIVFYVSFKYVFAERIFNLGFYALKGHVAALLASFIVTFPVGFFMAKYVVFGDSKMKWYVQMFRYFMVCTFNLALNYLLLKILVEKAQVYPTIAQVITLTVVILISYLAQRNFSFKAATEEEFTD